MPRICDSPFVGGDLATRTVAVTPEPKQPLNVSSPLSFIGYHEMSGEIGFVSRFLCLDRGNGKRRTPEGNERETSGKRAGRFPREHGNELETVGKRSCRTWKRRGSFLGVFVSILVSTD